MNDNSAIQLGSSKSILTWDRDFYGYRTKLDDSFPVSQFNIEEFSRPLKLDWNKNGASYIIASKLTSFLFPNDIETFLIKMNLKGS